MSDRTAYYKQYRERPEVKEKQKQHQYNWRRRHPEKALRATRVNRKKHGENYNAQRRKRAAKEIENLGDWYLVCLIRQQTEYIVGGKDIPKELVEIERIKLFTHRKLKQML